MFPHHTVLWGEALSCDCATVARDSAMTVEMTMAQFSGDKYLRWGGGGIGGLFSCSLLALLSSVALESHIVSLGVLLSHFQTG